MGKISKPVARCVHDLDAFVCRTNRFRLILDNNDFHHGDPHLVLIPREV
ncbi:MAG: hypothetical protein AAGD07_07875 [Planctomycetota bacterium]